MVAEDACSRCVSFRGAGAQDRLPDRPRVEGVARGGHGRSDRGGGEPGQPQFFTECPYQAVVSVQVGITEVGTQQSIGCAGVAEYGVVNLLGARVWWRAFPAGLWSARCPVRLP
jgi:hypothetical protein